LHHGNAPGGAELGRDAGIGGCRHPAMRNKCRLPIAHLRRIMACHPIGMIDSWRQSRFRLSRSDLSMRSNRWANKRHSRRESVEETIAPEAAQGGRGSLQARSSVLPGRASTFWLRMAANCAIPPS